MTTKRSAAILMFVLYLPACSLNQWLPVPNPAEVDDGSRVRLVVAGDSLEMREANVHHDTLVSGMVNRGDSVGWVYETVPLGSVETLDRWGMSYWKVFELVVIGAALVGLVVVLATADYYGK